MANVLLHRWTGYRGRARRGIKYRRENEHPTAAADVYEQNLATVGRVDDWQKRVGGAGQPDHSFINSSINLATLAKVRLTN